MVSKRWSTRSEAETESVGAELVRLLAAAPEPRVVLLEGDLGAGKTVLVRGLARALGVDGREVQSPSYSLIHEYHGERGSLVHVDLYRLEPEDVPSLGLDELMESPGWKAVEWAERLPDGPPPGAVRVKMEIAADGALRSLELGPADRRSSAD